MAPSGRYLYFVIIVFGTFAVWLVFNSLMRHRDEKYASLRKKASETMVKERHWLSHLFFKIKDQVMPKSPLHEQRPLEKITLLTWNIWFVRFEVKKRMNGVSSIIDKLKPNIITLNEVTRENLKLLASQPWYKRYRIVPTDLNRQEAYFVVILTNLPIQSWRAYPFFSFDLGWKLLVSTVNIPVSVITKAENVAKFSLTIATSHFESLSANTLIREKQLNNSLKVLSEYENACLMGDLNLEQKVDGEIMLPKPWLDAWLSLPGNSHWNGFTYNPSINKMIPSGEYTKDRFDRVLCKLTNFKVKRMKIVGKKPLIPGVFPSDHFGIFTVLVPETIIEKNTTRDVNAKVKRKLVFKRPDGWKRFLKS